ncbi:hypothetical protein O1611_g6566 [Lasiodiplodia mahajangana]|uniref:Uncharacterized protein n=1 Tax=Lasiodiplodia mahajangana TaxID=1108764 RepID=A0ACC2JHV2_9PEZI|nr:hypothetical protein O1611_g6566 [Lasiodiplodia mahajangana]
MEPTSSNAALWVAWFTVLKRLKAQLTFYFRWLLPFAFFRVAAADNYTDSSGTFKPPQSFDQDILTDARWTTTRINFAGYQQLGRNIRSGQCYENLSYYLSLLGGIAQADYNGASSALTLLPTIGALLGAPARELWILYKLVPLAGVLSMVLSFGGNIVPNEYNEYEREGYSYDGIISSTGTKRHGEATLMPIKKTDETTFAQCVSARADNPFGSSPLTKASIGMSVQLIWIGLIIFACIYTGTGAIIVWWCQAKSWMLAWYAGVAISSLVANAALVPFGKQWTMRVWKAPTTIEISNDAPTISSLARPQGSPNSNGTDDEAPIDWNSATPAGLQGDARPFQFKHTESSLSHATVVDEYRTYQPEDNTRRKSVWLHNLKRHGYNTQGQVYMNPNEAWASSRHPFMVIISIPEVTKLKATVRVLSKLVSVAVFVTGTAAFASTTLIAISVATLDLVLIITAAVLGRVAAIWMVSEMMEEKPVLHRIVQNELEAESFIREVLNTPGLTVELLGHVFINGKCVKRFPRFFNLSTIFGILAGPYKIEKLLTRRNTQP